MEKWFAVVDETGDLKSTGTVVSAELPSGWRSVECAEPGPWMVWDKESCSWAEGSRQPSNEIVSAPAAAVAEALVSLQAASTVEDLRAALTAVLAQFR